MTNSRAIHPDEVDVVVIGGGPAGSTAAARLARSGRSVLLLESRSMPRFHVGESLLPKTMPVLKELGVYDRIAERGFVTKHGAEFISPAGHFKRIEFKNSAFQVERARFDQMLFDYARECGAVALQEAPVRDLLLDGDTVTGVRYDLDGTTRTVRAAYVIDAAGRASKAAKTFNVRTPNEKLRMVAVFHHLAGLDESNNPGFEGDIQVGAHADGWLWAIPIRKDTISVGAVTPQAVVRDSRPEKVLAEHKERVARVSQRIAGTEQIGDIHVESDYCYYSDTVVGKGWVMAGDAGCFFDPIFSGGVHLAVSTGFAAAQTVDAILGDADRTEELSAWYQNFFKTGYDANGRIVYGYYDSEHDLRRLLTTIGLGEISEEDVRHYVGDVIAGDFWAEDNEFLRLLRAESKWDTFAPFPTVGYPLPATVAAS
jgi:FADH2-dependent halogenase/halogenation protein CepH